MSPVVSVSAFDYLISSKLAIAQQSRLFPTPLSSKFQASIKSYENRRTTKLSYVYRITTSAAGQKY